MTTTWPMVPTFDTTVYGEPIRTVPPEVLAVDIDAAIRHSRLPTNNDEIESIQLMLGAAIQSVENYTGLGLIEQTWQQTYSVFPSVIRLKRRPLMLSSGSPAGPAVVVSYVDGDGVSQILSTADYQVGGVGGEKVGATIRGVSGLWPALQTHPEGVTVTYTVGFGSTPAAVPDLIRHAVLLTFATFFEFRENLILGDRISQIPIAAENLLRDWRPLAVA